MLVYLQLCKNISLVFLYDWQDITDHVCAVTKALSKRPFKYARPAVADVLAVYLLSEASARKSPDLFFFIPPCRLVTEQSELPFCVDGSWASGARVERDGSGLLEVWSRQIQQLNRVSPAVASAVTASYPSPQLLLQVSLSAPQNGPT